MRRSPEVLPEPRRLPRSMLLWCALALLFLVVNWLTDAVTLKGHWTLYAARCIQGDWHDTECTGRLVAAEQYEFRTDKAAGTVSFTLSGGHMPASGVLSECAIKDGRSWVCPESSLGMKPVITQLRRGRPVGELRIPADTRLVPKWKWLFLKSFASVPK